MKGKPAASAADRLRTRILEEALPHVAFDGWTEAALMEAASRAGADEAEYKSAFPRGIADVLVFF